MQNEISGEELFVRIGRTANQNQANVSDLEVKLGILSKEFRRATRRHTYLRLAKWIRAPATTLNLWRTTVLVVSPMLVGVATFILVHFLVGSVFAASCAFLFGSAIGIGISSTLMYHPADSSLATEIHEIEVQLRLIAERFEQIASGKANRVALLQRDWRRLRGYDWEDYLVEICEALGAKVERTGQCGDQGCDLIVEFGRTRIAVQAKGFDEKYDVNHKAVQEAFAGMAFRSCKACAVITNTRFRKSARALAAKTGCILIGNDEFPDFVMGRFELLRKLE